MVYIPYLDYSYATIEDCLNDILCSSNDPEYAQSELEDFISEVFPDIDISNLAIDYYCWQEREGPHVLGWNFHFSFDDTEFKSKYPEYYI